MSFATGRVAIIDYVNWRGQRRVRRVLPHYMRWGRSEFHPEHQWLFVATDLADGVQKEFAMSGIRLWEVSDNQFLPWR